MIFWKPSHNLKIRRPHGLIILLLIGAMCHTAMAVDVTYRYFRFTPTKLSGGPSAGSIQLSELDIQYQGNSLITGATLVSNTGGNNPPGEGVGNLIDGNTATKWLDFNVLPVLFDFGAEVTADAYSFTTGNDAPERDPVSWTIEGSADNINWTTIDVRINHATTTNRLTQEDFTFPASFLPGISDFSTTSSIIISGQSATLSWTTSQASTVTLSGFGTVGANGSQLVAPTATTTYTLTASNSEGSTSMNITITVVAGATHTYRYYRFTPLKLKGTGNIPIQLAEFTFMDGTTPLAPVTVTNSGGNNPLGEGVGNLIDGNNTNKWLDFSVSPVVFDMGTPAQMTGYTLTTANDFGTRDPISWLLEGSDDQASWALIDHVTDYLIPDARQTETAFVPVAGASLIPYIESFSVDLAFVLSSESAELNWTTLGGNTWSITNVSNPVSGDSGNVTSDPITTTTTFTLTVTSVDSVSNTAQVSVDIAPPPPLLETISSDINVAGGNLQVTWGSTPARRYRVMTSTDLNTWTVLISGVIGATGDVQTTRNVFFPTGTTKRFFRIEEE